MSFALTVESHEVRAVVRTASERAKDPSVKSWLLNDEKGTWEKEARALLLDANIHEKAPTLGITTDAELRDLVADRLVYLALTATLNSIKKGKKA